MRESRGFWLYSAFLSSLFIVMAIGYFRGATVLGGGRMGPVHSSTLDLPYGYVPLVLGTVLIGGCLINAFRPRRLP